MRNDPRVRALEICLQQMQTGTSIDQLLEMYPHWAEELRPILQTAQAARRAADVLRKSTESEPFQAARLRSREKMIAALETGNKARHPLRRERSQHSGLRWLFTILLLLTLAGIGAFAGAAAASSALPGERLYPLKLASEKTRLTFVQGSLARLELEQVFDDERKEEVEQLIQRAKNTGNVAGDLEVHFVGHLSDRSPGNWQVGGIQILVPDDAKLVGQIQTGIAVEVRGHLQADGSVLASSIRPREFEVVGVLQKIESSRWLVEDVSFMVAPETILLGAESVQPAPGVKVRAKVFLISGQGLQARLIELNPIGKSPEIDNEIGGAPEEGIMQRQAQATLGPGAPPQPSKENPVTVQGIGASKPAEHTAEPDLETNPTPSTGNPEQQVGELEDTMTPEKTETATESGVSDSGGGGNADTQPRLGGDGDAAAAGDPPQPELPPPSNDAP